MNKNIRLEFYDFKGQLKVPFLIYITILFVTMPLIVVALTSFIEGLKLNFLVFFSHNHFLIYGIYSLSFLAIVVFFLLAFKEPLIEKGQIKFIRILRFKMLTLLLLDFCLYAYSLVNLKNSNYQEPLAIILLVNAFLFFSLVFSDHVKYFFQVIGTDESTPTETSSQIRK